MTSIGLLELIPNWWLIALGLALIGIELFFGFFILLWFGIGFVVVGTLGWFVDFGYGEIQLIFATAIGTVLLFAFRRKLITRGNAEAETTSTYEGGDIGQIQRHQDTWQIYYHGTHWQIANPRDDLHVGQMRKVIEIKQNQAWLSYDDPI